MCTHGIDRMDLDLPFSLCIVYSKIHTVKYDLICYRYGCAYIAMLDCCTAIESLHMHSAQRTYNVSGECRALQGPLFGSAPYEQSVRSATV